MDILIHLEAFYDREITLLFRFFGWCLYMAITCTLLSAAVYGDFINLGCDPGWTDLGNGYCYQVVTSKAVSRKNANYDCGTTFSALVTVSNVGEMVRANIFQYLSMQLKRSCMGFVFVLHILNTCIYLSYLKDFS